MLYTVDFKEIYKTRRLIEADNWHEALMTGIKMYNHGEIDFVDSPDADVELTDHPYKITESWSLDDVENVIRKKGYTFKPPLTDDKERAILLDMKESADETHGYCYNAIDKSIHRLYKNRLVQPQ